MEHTRARLNATYGSGVEPIRCLGRGAMGEVWQVRIGGVERALKIAGEDLLSELGAESAERFRREGEMLAGLPPHPGVVRIHGVLPGPPPGILLDLVAGESLAERLRRGPLEPEQLRSLVTAVAAALAHCHRHGIVHRDLKLENVMLGEKGPVLVDFGVARSASVETLTRTGAMVGTPAAMAPEQIDGRRVDARADVWAFGVLLFELLSGRKPFAGESVMALAHAILHRSPASLRDCAPEAPPDLIALTERCLAKSADDRPADGAALLALLEDPEDLGHVGSGRPRPRVWMALAAVLVLLAGPLAVSRMRRRAARLTRQRQDRALLNQSLGRLDRARERILSDLLIEPWLTGRGSPAALGDGSAAVVARVREELSDEHLTKLAAMSLEDVQGPLADRPAAAALLALSTGNAAFSATPGIKSLVARLGLALEDRHAAILAGDPTAGASAEVRSDGLGGRPGDGLVDGQGDGLDDIELLLRVRARLGEDISGERTPEETLGRAAQRAAAIARLPRSWRRGLERFDKEVAELWALTSSSKIETRRAFDGVLLSEPGYDALHRRLLLARLRQAPSAEARTLVLLRWWARITPPARERLAPESLVGPGAELGQSRRAVAQSFAELARPVMILQAPPAPLTRLEIMELALELASAAESVVPGCRPFDQLTATERGETFYGMKRQLGETQKPLIERRLLRLAERFMRFDVKPAGWIIERFSKRRNLIASSRPRLFGLGLEVRRLQSKPAAQWTELERNFLRRAIGRLQSSEESDSCVSYFIRDVLEAARRVLPDALRELGAGWIAIARRVARGRVPAPFHNVLCVLDNMQQYDTSVEARIEVAALVLESTRPFSDRNTPIWASNRAETRLEESRRSALAVIARALSHATRAEQAASVPRLATLAESDRRALLAALEARPGAAAEQARAALITLWAR